MSTQSETLALMKEAQANSNSDLAKAMTVSTGLVYYDLQAPALNLYPVVTPLRNETPRVGGGGDTATRWKAITAINSANQHPGVSEGHRGGTVTTTVESKTAAYIGFGLEDSVSFEADYAAQNFDDLKAKSALGLLRSMMIAEELHIFGGNASCKLGTTPTPTTTAGTAGSIASGTYDVACVALTVQGYLRSSLAAGVPTTIGKTNVDASTDTIKAGAAAQSATAACVCSGVGNNSISAYVTAVEGAAAYAWYVGTTGAAKLQSITKINSVNLLTLSTAYQLLSAAPAADSSWDATYDYDGLLYSATAANGATVKTLATGTNGTGTALTSDGSGGVTEINDVLSTMYDSYRIGPTDMLCSATDLMNITKLVVGNGGAPLFRFNMDAGNAQGSIQAGSVVGSYLNPITQNLIRVRVHPNAVQGTILMYSREIPYPLSGVGNVFQVKTRRDYYQIAWPVTTRSYAYGVYLDSVLQHYAPFSSAVIKNIKA